MSVSSVLRNILSKPEWQAGHAPRARHIALSQLPRRTAELPKGRAVVTVCRSGSRS